MAEPTRARAEGNAVIAASLDGVGILEEDAFVTANEELAACFGYADPDDLVGTSWSELYPQAERERIESEVLPEVRARQEWRGEVEGMRTDGSTFPQVLSVRRAGDGRLVWVVRDRSGRSGRDPFDCDPVSDRDVCTDPDEKADGRTDPQEIGDSGMRFRPLVETAPVPVVVFTAERGIVYSNREAVDLLGADDPDAVLGREPEQFVHPADRDRAGRRIRQVIEDREATEPVEYRLFGLDGDERFVEIATAPVTYEGKPGACVVIDDVTPYRRSQDRLRRERRFIETVIDAIDDVFYVIDEDGESYLWNEALVETTGYSEAEIAEMHPGELVAEDHSEYVPGLMEAIDAIEDRRVEVDIRTKDGERITHEFEGTTFEDPETGEVFRCGIARDVTERLERERRLECQRDELATLDRINRVLLETTRELIRTANREAIERTICTRLGDSDLYEFVWIGEREFDGDRIVPRTTAGDDRGYLDVVAAGADGGERCPADRAMRTGDVQVVNVDESGSDPWQDAVNECGFRSVAAVPLHHEGTVYGVLMVHTARENAFSDREQDGFDVLGRTVGFIVNAVRSHKLLCTDTVVELEFRVTDVDSAFGTVADDLDCELELEGCVASGQRWVLYFDVDGAPPEDVVGAAADDSRVERARVISASDADGRVELNVTAPSLWHTVSHAGASVRTAVAGPDDARLVVEAPVETDVREVIDPIQSEYPDVELLAQRDRDREVTTVGRPDGVLGGLTDRQLEVLEATYRAGYFAWPRESTANDVAESLDLASATLHGHLRKAEESILSTLFDEE